MPETSRPAPVAKGIQVQKVISRLSVLLLIIPLLLVAGCSDDDDALATGMSVADQQPTSVAAAPEASSGNAASDAVVRGRVVVDFTGAPEELEAIDAEFEVEAGTTAWDAIKKALGEENVSYQDFGGDLGIFITGFKGVEVEGNHFWEFKLDGKSAEAGVSKYKVEDGDVLEFGYTSF